MAVAKSLTLILGGARSGKSAFAQGLAAKASRVLFVATAEALDEEMAARIHDHQQVRPAAWRTLEEPRRLSALVPGAAADRDLVVLDCLTLWVSNLVLHESPALADEDVMREAESLLHVYRKGSASWVVVSNEVGLGVVPTSPLGRRYRDVLGRVNQVFAEAASPVYLLVAGLVLDLSAAGARPWQIVVKRVTDGP